MGLILRRLAGVALLAASFLPFHWLLDPERTGLAGSATRASADAAWRSGLLGTAMVLVAAVLLAGAAPRLDPVALLGRMAGVLERIPGRTLAAVSGLAAFALATGVAVTVLGTAPGSVDEMVQLLHARTLAGGRLALPLPGNPASWLVQNGVMTAEGWASVYPPLHMLALAAGLAVGAAWLVGPVAVGVAAAALARVSLRLFPEPRWVGRAVAVLTAVCPFLLFLGGTSLSHVSALAFTALLLWALLAARDGGWGWSVAAGAAMGALVATRPWTGLALSAGLVAACWLPRRAPGRWLLRRVGGAVAGGLPFAVLLLLWNRALFGSPFTLGYTVAFGPSHGLGFHPDPWGNVYGPVEALAYTGADLVQLGAHLFESPLPALALVGAALLTGGRLPRGSLVLGAWAGAGVLANALYWHHGIHMGPRFLYETGPAWVGLWVVSAWSLASAARGRPLLRRGVGWAVILSLGGSALLLPGTARAYSTATAGPVPPRPPGPALVFVHGSWPSRVTARLAASGMRRDSVEALLRQNDLCRVDRYARERRRGGSPALEGLVTGIGPAPEGLERRVLSPGNPALVDPTLVPDETCRREARADRLGTLALEPLLWQGPPLPSSPVVLARDLGPAGNAATLEALPRRTAWVLVPGEEPALLPYDQGVALLWRGAAGVSRAGGSP